MRPHSGRSLSGRGLSKRIVFRRYVEKLTD
jgi:hypothetical protein